MTNGELQKKRDKKEAKERRKSRRKILRWAIGGGLTAAVLVFLGYWGSGQTPPMPQEERFPTEGASHVNPGMKIPYKTDPPTSGDHHGDPAAPSFYTTPVPPELLVHNLEHGNIVIYYDESRLSGDDLLKIRSFTDRYREPFAAVLAVPRSDAKYPLILTAWTRMLRLTRYDPDTVEHFIDRYRGRGPERPVR